MPKIPILLIAGGLLIAVLGCAITGIIYTIQLTQSFNSTMDLATRGDEEAAKLCTENEKLIKLTGPSQYHQGRGYSSSVTFYCEDREGKRRDVTDEFGAKLVAQAGNVVASAFSVRWEFLCISGAGLLIFGAGIIMLATRVRS